VRLLSRLLPACLPACCLGCCAVSGQQCSEDRFPDENALFVVGSATSLYALAPPTSTQPNGCLSHSTTLGKEWSPCNKALNCTAANACNQLIIKDPKTMFMMRKVSTKTDGVISVTRNSNHTHAVLLN
jgi:hypothetical protein